MWGDLCAVHAHTNLCAEAPHVPLLLVVVAAANDTHQQILSFGSLLQLFYLSSWSTLVLHNLELLGKTVRAARGRCQGGSRAGTAGRKRTKRGMTGGCRGNAWEAGLQVAKLRQGHKASTSPPVEAMPAVDCQLLTYAHMHDGTCFCRVCPGVAGHPGRLAYTGAGVTVLAHC